MQHVLALFGESNANLIIICLVILLLFGGKKIPELARSVGKGVSEFKKGIRDVEHDAMTEMVNKQQTVAQPPAPVAAPVASQPAETQQFRFDPYTGKPLTNDTAKA